MKNRLPHLIAMLLACLMLLSSVSILAGCVKEDAPDTGTASGQNGTAGETSTEYVPDIAKKNYNTTFNVVAIGFNQDLLILDEDKKRDGNSLDEAVYERGVLVKEQLGVECEFADAGDWISYSGKIANTVQTGDDAYQLVLTHVYQGVTDLVTSNSLMNFTDLPSVNLDAPYWNRNLMESLKVDDRYLLGYSDFCLSSTHCVVFNKDMLQNYRLEDPYALVNNKKWTVDKLFSLASAVSEDNGDGKWTVDDYYGISGWGWVPLITFITSCDMKIVDRDEDTGRYYVAYEDNTEKMLSLIDKVTTMYKANYSYMWPSVNYTALKFAEGHSLFQLYSTTGLISLATEKIRFGVLPYPKFREARKLPLAQLERSDGRSGLRQQGGQSPDGRRGAGAVGLLHRHSQDRILRASAGRQGLRGAGGRGYAGYHLEIAGQRYRAGLLQQQWQHGQPGVYAPHDLRVPEEEFLLLHEKQ